jgi:hypothetical protein
MIAEQNKPINIEQIHQVYGELYPTEFEFLVLYNLYVNYPSSEIQHAEIKQAIVDMSKLPFITTGKDPQVERIFKGLLRTFIERVPSKFNRFILTPHTERVLAIALQRINNPYLKFPLKDTFEKYFALPEGEMQDITGLESWFKFGFQNTAQQVVIGHLEGLKLSVDDAVKELNQILEADDLSAIQMLEQFSENFQTLGDKARQITEAINMKVDVHYRLRDVVDKFAGRPAVQENGEVDYQAWQTDRRKALQIKEKVNAFFEKVDKQLDLINAKMAFASSKIAVLQDSFRTQSHYRINLKKMLVYLLENSRAQSPNGIKLPNSFPPRGLVQEKFRFMSIRYYDVGFLKRGTPFNQSEDTVYEESQRIQFEQELAKQAAIQKHCERIHAELSLLKRIELAEKLFEIMRDDKSLEIGIQTGYEFIRNLPPDSSIEIKEELQSHDNDIHLWKTTIHHQRDSIF